MGAAAGDEDAADGGSTSAAGEAGTLVDAMLHLEEAGLASGIDVIGDRGSAQTNGVLEDLAECETEALEFSAGEAARHAAGVDAGAEEALVGIDVADAGEEGLIEKGGLDRGPAAAEKGSEGGGPDGEGLDSGSEEGGGVAEVFVGEAAEAARIDEAKLAAAGESEAGVGVWREGRVGIGEKKTAGHAEVHDPLGFGS